jgi:hypothetical protein
MTHNGSLTVTKMTQRRKEKKFLFVDLVPNSDEASAAVGHQCSDELSLFSSLLRCPFLTLVCLLSQLSELFYSQLSHCH